MGLDRTAEARRDLGELRAYRSSRAAGPLSAEEQPFDVVEHEQCVARALRFRQQGIEAFLELVAMGGQPASRRTSSIAIKRRRSRLDGTLPINTSRASANTAEVLPTCLGPRIRTDGRDGSHSSAFTRSSAGMRERTGGSRRCCVAQRDVDADPIEHAFNGAVPAASGECRPIADAPGRPSARPRRAAASSRVMPRRRRTIPATLLGSASKPRRRVLGSDVGIASLLRRALRASDRPSRIVLESHRFGADRDVAGNQRSFEIRFEFDHVDTEVPQRRGRDAATLVEQSE
jgi:hypothetical protein